MIVKATRTPVLMLRAIRRRSGIVVLAVLAIWVGLPRVPEGTGLQFGWVYRVFFTVVAVLTGLFFWFLGRERIRVPEQSASVAASVAGVFVVTVAFLVVAGALYPQFPVPQAEKGATGGGEAADRGRQLFVSASVGCFRCHVIAGEGGVRGPDLTQIATTAGRRVPGATAEDYLLQKVAAGSTYDFKVPKYAPIMPPFEDLVSKEQIEDLVAYLLTLKGAPAAGVEDAESGD